jgi:demethylmenaquinone methyltransferase/2-methoxy-6-polyprenyl-1,4-benzoquinol methylase
VPRADGRLPPASPRDARPLNDSSLAAYYAARAGEYERIYDKPERQADLRRLERWLPKLVAGRRVLEVACGTGYWTRLLAATAAHVLATDLSAETLAVARAKGLPPERVAFRQADAYALSADLGTFDAAVACFWWSHVPAASRPRFFAALHHRLEPGARVVLLDNLYVPGSSTPISRTDAAGDTYQLRTLESGDTFEVVKNFPTEELLRAEAAGLAARAELHRLDYYWVFTDELPG